MLVFVLVSRLVLFQLKTNICVSWKPSFEDKSNIFIMGKCCYK